MLKIRKIFTIIQNILFITLLLFLGSMFYIRYRMYVLSKNISYLDEKIKKLEDNKELLTIELTYLTSTERILSLIDKNPSILNNKQIIKASQLKSKEQLVEISLAKANNRVYENRKLAEYKNENNKSEI